MSAPATFLSALAVSALCCGGAAAQIFTGVEPRQPLVIPHPVASPAPARPAVPAEVAPSQPRPVDVLRPLPNTLEGFRVTGETGELQWPVALTRAQAEGSVRFRLTYLSAVSNLDEASAVTLKVNGRAVSSLPIDAPQAAKSVEFAIPPGLLARGTNAVSLAFSQRHRVDCSVPATYELWTQVDRTQTGLVLTTATAEATDLADIPALLPDTDGTLPIRIVLAARTNPAQIGRFIQAVQRITIAGHFLQPSVDFGPFADDPHGLNLVVGTREALRALAPVGAASGISGPLARLVRLADSPRPTLLISGSDDAEVEAAIAQVGAYAPEGTPAGLLAAASYPGLPTAGGARLHLSDFGVGAQEFSGRFLRRGFDLKLPADFLSADYAHGTFDLAGGYAAGLAPGAQVRIDVNGHNAGQIKLPSGQGDVFRHNQMFVPLSLLRPGVNRVEILAETPKAEDAACDAAAITPPRFLLLDSSELQLPTLARVQRLPDLALAAAGGLPFTTGRPKLFVPKPGKEAMAAALSLVGSAAVAAGRVLPFEFTTLAPTDDTGATLIVAPAQALDRAVMTDIGLDPAAVEAAWRGQVEADPKAAPGRPQARWWDERSDGPAACRVPHPLPARGRTKVAEAIGRGPAAPVAASAQGLGDDDLFERWNINVRGTTSWRERVAAVPARVGEWVGRRVGALTWPTLAQPAESGIGPRASLILAQGFTAGSPEHTTTIVTAPDAATLKASVACLTDPQVWSQVHGRLSVLDAADGTLVATDADRFRYTNGSGSSLGNMRLVMAGWFSLNPLAFVALALLTALCLSGTTLVFVRGVGRKGAK